MRNYVIFSILIIIGLLLLLIQPLVDSESYWYTTIGNISNTLLIGGTLSLLYDLFLKKEENENLLKMLKISFSVHDSGLRQIMTNSADYKFSALLTSSEKFIAIMNDGLRWVGNHSPEIESRFNKKDTLTEFYFVDPNSEFCKALAIKTEVSLSDLQGKIKQTISLIDSTYKRSLKKGKLRVYLLKNYPTQSIFLTENKIVVTPYQTASGRNVIPLFEYDYKEGKKSLGLSPEEMRKLHITYRGIITLRKESLKAQIGRAHV